MWKYNKYNIGEIVGHKDSPSYEFQINDILCSEPEKQGEYLYCCSVTKDKNQEAPPHGWATAVEVADDINNPDRSPIHKTFKYAEAVLFPIRKATSAELNELIKQTVKKEAFEIAASIQQQVYELKRNSKSKELYLLELKNDLIKGAKHAYVIADKIDDLDGSPNSDAVKIVLKYFKQKSVEDICRQADISCYKHKGYFFLSASRPWHNGKNTTFIEELYKFLKSKGHEVYTCYRVD